MAEKEYIEREVFKKHIKDLPTWTFVAKADGAYEKATKYPEGMFDCDDVIASIENAPAADVVEVVRCKNCKHRDKSGLCQAEGQKLTIAKDNHFCSKGERRQDNG